MSGGTVVLRVGSDNGAEFSYGLEPEQALGLRDALARAAVVAACTSGRAEPPTQVQSPQLAAARRAWSGHREALDLLDRCAPLLSQLDAANDEGRTILRANASALVECVRERFPQVSAVDHDSLGDG
jgi:hypothetical protein